MQPFGLATPEACKKISSGYALFAYREKRFEATIIPLKILEILDYRGNRLSQVTCRHEIECSRPKRFHEFLKFIEHVIDVQAETKVIDAAITVTFNNDRFQVRSVLEQKRTRHHDKNSKRFLIRGDAGFNTLA